MATERLRVTTQKDEENAKSQLLAGRIMLVGIIGIAFWVANLPPEPPKHRVISEEPLHVGKRITLAVTDPYLSREDCIKILDHWAERAKGGQVQVMKPAPLMDGRLQPWCVDNQDGKGASFNDFPFGTAGIR